MVSDMWQKLWQASRVVWRTPMIVIIGAAFISLNWASAAHAEITLTDITGRNVVLPAPATRILLASSAYYPALSLLSHNAADLVVGVGGLQSGGEFEGERDLAGKPHLGSIWAQTFSIEKALELEPDLLIAAIPERGRPAAIEQAFAKTGVPIVYIDFVEDPARNTAPSIEIIGRAIGEEEKAAEFIDFQARRIERIIDWLEAARPTRPKLAIISRRSGLPCCWTSAQGSVTTYFGDLNVINIADGALPGRLVQLSLEYLVERDPDIFVANDLSSGPDSLFGEPRNIAHAMASLEELATEPGFRDLAAMRSRRVHAIDVSLMRSPLSILAVEVFAKWIHPELFADIDPQATLDEINRRFLATPLKGPFWASLDPASNQPSEKRR